MRSSNDSVVAAAQRADKGVDTDVLDPILPVVVLALPADAADIEIRSDCSFASASTDDINASLNALSRPGNKCCARVDGGRVNPGL